jgi:CRP-like cAMP-binding protein
MDGIMKPGLEQNSKRLSSIERTIDNIANGSIAINSIDAMRDIIKKAPNEPYLLKIYADMLLEHKLLEEAAKVYDEAASLYHKNGKMLSAIVAKISQWHYEMPSGQSIKIFFSDLKKNIKKDLPINNLFSKLSIEELKSFCFLFEKVRLPADHTIKEIGDVEHHLFLIVSGRLEDSIYLTLQNQERIFRKPTIIMSENDYFGEIYPFTKEQRCQSYIKTLRPTELVSISKEKLLPICRKFPNIELAIIDLLKIRSQFATSDSSAKLRRSPRYEFKLKLNLEIFPEKSDENKLTVEGFSLDISVGGMGIILDLNLLRDKVDISSFLSCLKNAKIRLDITKEACSLLFSGRIAWCREIVHEGVKTIAIGVQFSDMSPRTQGFLFAFINSLQ